MYRCVLSHVCVSVHFVLHFKYYVLIITFDNIGFTNFCNVPVWVAGITEDRFLYYSVVNISLLLLNVVVCFC